jgi:hypothetical protein
MRPADQAEVGALGYTPLGALAEGFEISDPCLTIVAADGEPIGMFGAVPWPDRQVANVWLLATEKLVTVTKRQFIRECRAWVDGLNAKYPLLTNLVDARNTVHLRWLRWCGFEFGSPLPINGHQFIPFARQHHVRTSRDPSCDPGCHGGGGRRPVHGPAPGGAGPG